MTAKAPKFDVVISGGSFAGLALACGLTNASGGDVAIAIVDRATGPAANDDRAFAIWRGAQLVLESLGVWQDIAPNAQRVESIEISDSALHDGVRATRLTYDAILDGGEPALHIVPAADLHRALLDAARRNRSISWFTPHSVVGLETTAESALVSLDGGAQLRGDLCVAADGRSSKLRDAAGITTVGWDYGQTGVVATIACEEPHGGVAIQHFLPGGPFAILPLRGNRACITWSAERDEAERMLALGDDEFLAELDQRIAGRFGAIELAGSRQSWPLDFKTPRELTASRFALIGDAAHGVHPIAGQGVNLALRDAAALVECVIDAMRVGFDAGHAPALERYARWRRFDSLMSASLYDGLNRLFSVDNIVLRAGRGASLGILDRIPAAKQLILSEAAGQTGDLPKMARGLPV